MIREYYKIRFTDKIGEYGEWHSSNNGTSQWSSVAKVKSVLTRGIRGGYKGMYRNEFENFEVIRVTENVKIKEEVVEL